MPSQQKEKIPAWEPNQGLEISVQDLAAARKAKQNFRLIDCREEDEFQFCQIRGSQLMPLSQFSELAENYFTDLGETVVVLCHHGMRSAQATNFLRAKGLERAFSLAGGIEQWSLEIDPKVPRY